MRISLPIISPFKTFDATKDFVVAFAWDGSQVYGNEVKVIKNDSGDILYDNTVTSFILQHIIPANTLTNAIQYSLQIRVFDKDHNWSEWSNASIFTTHSTPTISINIENNQLIQSSNYDVDILYNSADEEILNTWVLYFYDNSGNLIFNTDIQYAATTMTYKLTALESSSEYKIKVIGNTVDDTSISTDLITFQVQYTQLSIYYNAELENIFDKGQIRVASNLISIDGKAIPNPTVYINNKEIDLTSDGSSVLFDDGFTIKNNYSLQLLFRNLVPYQILCESSNGTDTVKLKYMKAIFDSSIGYQGFFLLEVSNGGYLPYRIATEPFALLMDQYVYVVIKRINNLYALNMLDGNMTVDEWNYLNLTVDDWNTKSFSNDQFRMSGKMFLKGVIV